MWADCAYILQELNDGEGQIIACLQDSRDMLLNPECADQVHKTMARASEDIRFNQMLADACLNDREQFCSSTQQVSCMLLLYAAVLDFASTSSILCLRCRQDALLLRIP